MEAFMIKARIESKTLSVVIKLFFIVPDIIFSIIRLSKSRLSFFFLFFLFEQFTS